MDMLSGIMLQRITAHCTYAPLACLVEDSWHRQKPQPLLIVVLKSLSTAQIVPNTTGGA